MTFFLSLLRFIAPSAHAAILERVGSADPSVGSMWGTILGVFPHTGLGRAAPAFFFLKITAFILGTIAAAGTALLIYAGIVLTVSSGEKLEETKQIVGRVAIGLILAMLADGIIALILWLVINAASA